MSAREALKARFVEYAIREGEFTLASGKTSNWYVDGRQVTFRGDCVDIVGDSVLEALGEAGVGAFDSVGGLAIGADPVTVAVARSAGVRGFAVRKEAKGHGVGGRIAGPLRASDRVLVVEDTVTTGGSLLEAIDAIVEFGATIVAATTLLDRGGTLRGDLRDRGITYVPVFGAPDFGFAFGT
ncbi:MAG: orotate phosphoribosyltransferase [Acidimicrobiia bacterium]